MTHSARHAGVSFAIGAGLLVVAAIWGAARFPALPDRVPVHWNGAGVADGFAAKSVWSVFGVLIIGFAIAVGLYALAVTVHRFPQAVAAGAGSGAGAGAGAGGGAGADASAGGASAGAGAAGSAAARHGVAAGRLIGRLLVVIALNLSVLTVLGWYPSVPSWAIAVVVWAGTALMVAVVVVFIVRSARAGAFASQPSRGGAGSGATGDADAARRWRGGVFYVDREDPAVFVPKRLGVGWTVNFGSPVGIAIGVGLAALIVFVVVLAVTGA